MRHPKNILIIDDDPRMRDLMHRQLRLEGYAALEAEDGAQALFLLRAHRKIDLVLLDILIPFSSGLDIFDSIRKEFPAVPIVVTSVYSKEEQEFLVWDADGYYYKSESLVVLMQQIRRIFHEKVSVSKGVGNGA